jgi:hypothetical protein
MVTYFFMIDHVLSSDSQVLARVIPIMERAQGLLGTLEVVFDCQPLPTLRVLAIIELSTYYIHALFLNATTLK